MPITRARGPPSARPIEATRRRPSPAIPNRERKTKLTEQETIGAGYSEVFIGECTVGSCTRPATVRIWENFVLCALHHAMHEAAHRGDDAHLALELLRPWRDHAQTHRLGGLIEDLDRIIADENIRYLDAQEYMSQLERIEVESVPNEDIRLQMGARQQEKASRPEPEEESAEAPTVLTAVNRLLQEASVLLSESHPPTEEEEEAQLEAKHAIADAGLILAKEMERKERSRRPRQEDETRSTTEETGREHWTPEEREHWDARAEEEAWGLAWSILYPWVESARYIGSDELTQVMEKALEEVDGRVNAAMDKREKAESALQREEKK